LKKFKKKKKNVLTRLEHFTDQMPPSPLPTSSPAYKHHSVKFPSFVKL